MQALEKGTGPMECIRMQESIWEHYTPKRLESVGFMHFNKIRPVLAAVFVMPKALVRQGVMHPCHATGSGPNWSLFPIPTSSEKASLICSWILS